jgi:hypothetical protein
MSQELPSSLNQQLENLAEMSEEQSEDDGLLQQLVYLRQHPLNLNRATKEQLQELYFLNQNQVQQFISYRQLLGDLLTVYELQSIPGWDINTIYKIRPYITVKDISKPLQQFKDWISGGEHSFLLRTSGTVEQPKGFKTGAYGGDNSHTMVRYQYRFNQLLQYGFTADKDAGESFFKGSNRKGFDFYSGHLFIRKNSVIKTIAIGDFTANLGQGLIQWQAMAFKKSSEVLAIKRHAAVLRPYASSGEIYFNRGLGVTLRKNHWETTIFASAKKISGNSDRDTSSGEEIFTSILSSGLYRTVAEKKDKNNVLQNTLGGNLTFAKDHYSMGLNVIHHQFSKSFEKEGEPYNLYAWRGSGWTNVSMDYGTTYKNLHFFGEAALDKKANKALINGVLISAHAKLDFSFIHRVISKRYQSIYGNAFTESIQPANENGFYMGASMKLLPKITLQAYADIYQFPWLRYRTDAPGGGKDFLLQITYKPNKVFEAYSRYRYENKEGNTTSEQLTMHYLAPKKRGNWRTHASYAYSQSLTLRGRADFVWYTQNNISEKGYLIFGEVHYKYNSKVSGNVRVQHFNTDGFESRLYAFENDVLYGYSIPSFFDKGMRYYMNVKFECSKKVSLWLRAAQSHYANRQTIGSGLDEISGNTKTEVKFQALLKL